MSVCLQVPEETLRPSLSVPDISPRRVAQGCGGGVVLPPAEGCHPGLTPKTTHFTGIATNVLGEPQSSAAALSDHTPSWCNDMGDDILKLLIARAHFYDKAIRLARLSCEGGAGGLCMRCACVRVLLLSLISEYI